MIYLACTLLARLEHEAGNAAGAERMYREALAAWPDGQRAAVGLSHAIWLQRRLVTPEFLRRDDDVRRPDPWASYSLGQYATLDRRIAERRQMVWP